MNVKNFNLKINIVKHKNSIENSKVILQSKSFKFIFNFKSEKSNNTLYKNTNNY